jgi:hypothetical protein
MFSRDLNPISQHCDQGNKTAALAPYEPSGFSASLHGTDGTNKSKIRWPVPVVTVGQRKTKTKKQ